MAMLTGRILTLTVILALASSVASAQYYGWGNLIVETPASGDEYTQGDAIPIKWYATYDAAWSGYSYRVDYSSNGGSSWNEIQTVDGYTNYIEWNSTTSNPAGTNYMIRVVEIPNYGGYWYNAFNYDGYSGTFTLIRACGPATITSIPGPNQAACAGTSITWSIAASMQNGTYNWRQNGTVVASTRVPTVTITNLSQAKAGLYDCVLTDDCDPEATITTTPWNLTVWEPPVITQQPPATYAICESDNGSLTVTATGTNLTYQWRKDGVNIPGATSRTLTINNAGAATPGSYTCVVSGTCSPTVTTSVTIVTVPLKPRVVTEPVATTFCPGANGQLTIEATGTSLSYEWYRGNALIATTQNLAFTNFSSSNVGLYRCVVKSNVPNPNNCIITAQSAEVLVGIFEPPVLATDISSADACAGQPLELSSSFTGPDLTYQWYRNGSPIAGQTTNTFRIERAAASDAGTYYCMARGACGLSASTAIATITVVGKPSITMQPASITRQVGEEVILSVAATDARTYQWFFNSKPIDGATESTYRIPSVRLADAGYYFATISNVCGGVTSRNARVSVTDPKSLQPNLLLATENANFGEIPIGYSTQQTLTNLIGNDGTAPLTVQSITIAGAGYTLVTAPATPFTLAPGAFASVEVRAEPTVLGPANGSMTVTTDAPIPTGTVDLLAESVLRYGAPASLAFNDTEVSKSSEPKCFDVTNTSAVNVTIDAMTVGGAAASDYSLTTTLPISFAPGETKQVCVVFTPSVVGDRASSVAITSSTGGNSSMTLSGRGTPTVSVDGDEVAGTSVYPNPATDEVTIRVAAPSSVVIVDGVGSVVTRFEVQSVGRWNLRSQAGTPVATGPYRVVVTTNGSSTTVPITVVR